MKVAIVSFYFSESTLPLFKCLSENENHEVKYFYVQRYNVSKEIAGFSLQKKNLIWGLNKIKKTDAKELFDYLGNSFKNVYIIYLPPKIFTSNYIANIFFKFLKIQLNIFCFDIVNIVGHDNILLYFKKIFTTKKEIHTIHEAYNHFANNMVESDLLKAIIKCNDNIIVHSKFTFEKMVANCGLKRNLINYIPFGLFETYRFYLPSNTLDIDDYVLFYGAISPYKGIDTLFAAIEILNKSDINKYKFVIAGKGDLSKYICCNYTNLKIINRHLANNEIVELNKKAKLIVCPYHSASQSGIIMTTFLFNKPIIATNVGAFPEVINNNVNSLLINADSPLELADSIEELYSNKQLYNDIVYNIMDFKNSNEYNWSNITIKTENLFNEILEYEK